MFTLDVTPKTMIMRINNFLPFFLISISDSLLNGILPDCLIGLFTLNFKNNEPKILNTMIKKVNYYAWC
ncbi:NAD-dependent glyceraldehyde-3-phosphate dehydrogenase [Chryseobacterium sp. StRB126]|nr:NAD-dependent glyceraldehyde-3-phosphate dehydrogenase [Chryseobacterium sp. StRB126]